MKTDTQKERIEYIENAFTSKKVEDQRESIIIINDLLLGDNSELMRDMLFKLGEEMGNGSFELSYEVMSQACDIMSEVYNEMEMTGEEYTISDDTIYERSNDNASVYTATRLSYMNIWNENDIADIMKEYGTESISTACAIWYDKQVQSACFIIKEFIEKD